MRRSHTRQIVALLVVALIAGAAPLARAQAPAQPAPPPWEQLPRTSAPPPPPPPAAPTPVPPPAAGPTAPAAAPPAAAPAPAAPAPAGAPAGAPSELDIFQLDETLNKPQVQLATKTVETARETSAIITTITRDEILASGARDLMDILHLVPGFAFGVDTAGVVGVGFRGLWGHEGKILVLVDGLEMNERLYSTFQFGQHIPADIIQRVEVIRGPGSVIYGGYAELAVINVVTRDAEDLKGASSSLYFGAHRSAIARWSASLSYGDTFESVRGLALTLHGFFSNGVRSERNYVDFSGQRYSLSDFGELNSTFVNLGARYKDLKFRFILDYYKTQVRDGFGPVAARADDQRFTSYIFDLQYDWKILSTLTLTPRLSYTHQTPWQVKDVNSDAFYDKTVHRLRGTLIANWDLLPILRILVGVDAFMDRAQVNSNPDVGLNTTFDGQQSVTYGDVAGFVQGNLHHWIANVTAGFRYEFHSQFGNSFVPRIAVTKVIQNVNFKLLYSRAFRAPGVENFNLNPDVRPENTQVAEAEIGFLISKALSLTFNGFWIRIDDPIVYTTDPRTNSERYINESNTGTAGFESEIKAKGARGFAALNYSFYSSANQNSISSYAVPGRQELLLGFPTHKVSFNGSVNLHRRVSWNLSGVFFSDRYGYLRGSEGSPGVGMVGNDGALVLVNSSLTFRNLGVEGLNLSAGGFNLVGQTYRLLQPYDGGHAPLPVGGREIFLRLVYRG